MKSWLSPPALESAETEHRVVLLRRVLKTMFGLAVLAQTLSVFDEANDWRINVAFYSAIYAWLAIAWVLVRRGKVVIATWSMGLFYWLVIALVTLFFGGMQGQYASVFSVIVLLIGSIIGGKPAIIVALMSFAWSGFVVYLELHDWLPEPLIAYSPVNAWAAVTTTVLFTSFLLHQSLLSLERMNERATRTAEERDEALRRSIQGQKMELVGNLTSGIAHDFNNLLSVVTSASDALRNSPAFTLPDDEEALDDLDEASSRAVLLTRQLLSFGRAKAGEPETVDLAELVLSLRGMLPRLLSPDIEIQVETCNQAWVFAPRAGLEQVVLNLTVNARDAMPDGGTFRTRVEVDEGQVVLSVSDTGVGMTEEHQARIFEPFFSTKENGTGLGLSTVRQQLERTGGKIGVFSRPNQGATFRVCFPLAAPPLETDQPSSSKLLSNRPKSPGRVVLVEDEPLVRRATGRVLRSAGYEVLAFADGEEALPVCLASDDLICVVTDLVMPRLDGESLARSLAQHRPQLPIIMMSGNREPDSSLLNHSLTRYLTKPVAPALLILTITQLTHRVSNESSAAREL